MKKKLILLVLALIPLEAIADYYLFGQYSGFGIIDYMIRCGIETGLFIMGIIIGSLGK